MVVQIRVAIYTIIMMAHALRTLQDIDLVKLCFHTL